MSRLIGTKIFVNELVAYGELGGIIKLRENIIANHTFDLYHNGTLDLNSEMIWNVWIFKIFYIQINQVK